MDDPVGALIGALLMGFGTLVLYGAFKNKKVFGANGLLATALTTGSIIDIKDIPEAYKSFTIAEDIVPTNSEAIKGAAGKVKDIITGEDTKATWSIPPAVRDAIISIGQVDATLATKIADEVNKMDSKSTRVKLMPLGQLLLVARMKGHATEVNTIKNYVRELTGESL